MEAITTDYIKKIVEMYNGNIILQPPCQREMSEDIPQEIRSILCISNGIQETIAVAQTDQPVVIGWIIEPYDMMMSDTAFYRSVYKIDGVAFATDGAGNPFIIKPNGTIICFNGIENDETEVADSLSDFFEV